MAAERNKPKRSRGWKSELKDAPRLEDIYNLDADGNPTGAIKAAGQRRLVAWLHQWARDMSAWGQDVRDDLIRVEGQAGFATGDPGDPPGGPPNGDE